MITLCLCYTLKPLTTTNFILSLNTGGNGVLTYVTVEIIAKVLFVFITMIAITNKAFVSTMEAIGLMLALLSQHLYYHSCDRFKDEIQIKSACDALKSVFDYDSIDQLKSVEHKLDYI